MNDANADTDSVELKIKKFLVEECGVSADDFDLETQLFSSGLLDSIEVLKILSFLEDQFSVQVSAFDVSLDHFESINLLAEFVRNKLA